MNRTAPLPDAVWWPLDDLDPEESLLGFAVRTMEDNEMPHLASILREAGQAHRNRTVDIVRGDASSEAIAAVLGIPLTEVVARRGHVDADGRCHYRGVEMRPMDIVSSERRFAPGSLRREPFHRAAWMLRQLPFCPISWEPLIYQCSCGARQDWIAVRDILRCSGCSELLTKVQVDKIPKEQRSALSLYANLLSADPDKRSSASSRLPCDVARLAPGHAVELILALVPLAEPRIRGWTRSPSIWRDQPMLMSAAIAKVVDSMLAGQETFTRVLLGRDPKDVEPRTKELRRLSSFITGRRRIALPEPVVALLTAAEDALSIPGLGEETTLDVIEAEAVLGRARSTLRSDRRAGILRTAFRIRQGEILPVLDRVEIERIAAQRTIGVTKLGRILGVPAYGVAQMADARVLRYAEHPFVWKTKGLRILVGEDGRLLDALQDGSIKISEGEAITLYSVLRCVGGRQKPYGQILRALLDGEIGYELVAGVVLTSRIHIRRSDAASLLAITSSDRTFITFPGPTEYSQMDACDVLNLHARSREAVLGIGHSVRAGSARLPVDSVHAIGRARVSLTELSARTGIHSKTLTAALGPQTDAFGWVRDKACDILGLTQFV